MFNYHLNNKNILIVKAYLFVKFILKIININFLKKPKTIIRNIRSNEYVIYIIIRKLILIYYKKKLYKILKIIL